MTRYEKGKRFPSAIYNINSKLYSGTPENIARQYLLENKDLLMFKNDLNDLVIYSVKTSPGGTHVKFSQTYKGLPVVNGGILVSINKENKVTTLLSSYIPDLDIDINPKLSSSSALSIVENKLNLNEVKDLSQIKTELNIYEKNNKVYLIWVVGVNLTDPFISKDYYLDANTGEILKESKVEQSFTGSGRVFNPDPVTALNNPSLTYLSDVSAAYKTVYLNNLNAPINGNYYLE
ncbi:MAG: hypothetical protein F9K45_02965 [Melioribacteraceae bacterium]|nr:MAG: hypothetical protein F9K45_02965 [Melioribacteraceae bacterium]